MPSLTNNLTLNRCPHCGIAEPNLTLKTRFDTKNHAGVDHRFWGIFICSKCGGVVTAWSRQAAGEIREHFPSSRTIDNDFPDRPRAYLQQALDSLNAPAGAVMLSASAVDAMLKLKGYANGNLYQRIEKAVEDHLITADMGKWAHDVRLDANDQRHADHAADLPTGEDAARVIDFATALAQILFVLPNRVQRGIREAEQGGEGN